MFYIKEFGFYSEAYRIFFRKKKPLKVVYYFFRKAPSEMFVWLNICLAWVIYTTLVLLN